MKRDWTLFGEIWIGIAFISGLVAGFSMTPPILNSTKDQLVIDANDTLTITCRGQHILDWTWPDQSLSKEELSERQQEQLLIQDQRALWVKECQGEPGKPYCKTLVLTKSQSNDTGYYRCFYQDIKAVIDGTTAASLYVFVRDPDHPFIKSDNMETIFITASDTHIEVPCLVSDPELKVSLFSIVQPSVPFENKEITWNSKRGWSVPRHVIYSMDMILGFFCSLTLNDREYRSRVYIMMESGRKFYDLKLFPEDSPIELMRDDVLILNCTALVEHNTGVEFKWAYPGQKENRVVNFQSIRNSITQATEATSILTIQNVNINDSGYYTCSANGMERSLEQSTLVIVHEKPFISVDYRNGSVVEATAGQKSVKLLVKVSAYPIPVTHWYKNVTMITRRPEFSRFKIHNHNLEIRDVHREDAGDYTLVLKNNAAAIEKKLHFILIVNVPPQIHEKEAAAPSNPYRKGSRQTLTCTATGYPPPTSITWQWRPWSPCGLNSTQRSPAHRSQRDKVPLCQDWLDLDREHTLNPVDNMETLSEPVDGKQKTVGRVVISSANVSAMYKCSAENKVGKDERLIYFYVTTIPEGFGIEMEPSEEPLELEPVYLKCSADNYTYENLHWYRLDPQAVPPEDCKSLHRYAEALGGQLSFHASTNNWELELRIPSVHLQDEGNYVCEVQNRRSGEKHCHRKYVSVKALEAPRYRHNPINQTVNVSASLQMECDVEGTPSPQLSWFKDNQPLHQISGSDNNTNVEIVILIGTGVIAIFFWVLLLLIFCNVKRVNPADIKTSYLSIIMDPGEVPLEEQCEYLPYDSSQWEISRDRLRLGKVLGHGAFGKVIEASIYGSDKKSSLGTVAVKMLKEGATASEHKALMSELKILIHIGNHLNVVNLLGACTKPNGPLMVVVEYCKYGNLSNYLRAKREFFLPYRDRSPKTRSQVRRMMEAGQEEQRDCQPSSSVTSTPRQLWGKSSSKSSSSEKLEDLWKKPLTIEDLICYSYQVARGMEFLASRKCIHRDLAARNILLSENNVVKICDFGLARDIYKDPDYVRKGNARLPLKWMAPESIFDKVYTSQSDVWSFGVLLWEIFSLGASPYPGIQIDEEFCKRLKDGTRMRAPETASPEIYGIMLACWQGEPRERPTFPALVEILGDLLQDNSLPDIPFSVSQSSEDDGFSQASSRPPSEEELRLACNTLPARYYNCVPFSGCVMVNPSKTCHSRVKTFEELPMVMTSHKSHHDSQTDSGMVLASEELERLEHKHRGAMLMAAGNSTEQLIDGSSENSTSISRHRPVFFSQLSGQTFYNNEYGQLAEEGMSEFFSTPELAMSEGCCPATSNL
ncbi:vascular endothelial growth factor receptor 3 isoform X2 [Hemibagrus wyckioides]|uniref:vascular endothelial growth factor receptor 3 isoform X2 n=1 Tax=Hemibagrus wyckioides TaxID=337641 RepID=UPI00266BBBD0|nr:vascular endothelial growth factor receptor 3 isoform X2 [Hemibagrus wyckioides]